MQSILFDLNVFISWYTANILLKIKISPIRQHLFKLKMYVKIQECCSPNAYFRRHLFKMFLETNICVTLKHSESLISTFCSFFFSSLYIYKCWMLNTSFAYRSGVYIFYFNWEWRKSWTLQVRYKRAQVDF